MNEASRRSRAGPPGLPLWELEVVAAHDISPCLRRVVVTSNGLDGLEYLPGQSMILRIQGPGEDVGRREYTIRGLDRERREMELDFVLHAPTPGPEWARNAVPGVRVESRGPRGRTVFRPGADWHLFLGDETCVPAILHILETMPAGERAFAFVEVGSSEDEMTFESAADVSFEWLHRGGLPAGPGPILLDRLRAFVLPEGKGHAYVIGETSNVRAQRHHLIERGLTRAQISSEGYWRPGRIGGHDHVED